MAIQSQGYTMLTLTSLFILRRGVRKIPNNKLSRSKTQRVEGLTDTRITNCHVQGRHVHVRESFAYLRFFSKVSVPVKSIIP